MNNIEYYIALWQVLGVPNSGMDERVTPYCQQPAVLEVHKYQVGALVQEGKAWRRRSVVKGDGGFSATRQAYTE